MSEYSMRMDLQRFAGEKTEPATPRKREEARKKGQVAKSSEVGTAAMVLAGFASLRIFGPMMFARASNLVQHFLTAPQQWDGSAEGVHALYIMVLGEGMLVLLPIFGTLLTVALLSQGIQVGLRATWESLQPKFSRVNPLEGVKRVFSKRALVEFAKSLGKIAIIGYLAYREVLSSLQYLPQLGHMDTLQALTLVGESIFSLVILIGLALLIIAGLDYFYQRYEFETSIKMSKQDIKDELKQSEGDPMLRSKIRQKQREMSSHRMMENVPTADVVITNPTHFSIALRYDPGSMSAPEVVAKGAGFVALKIKELGRENGIAVVENAPLARALYKAAEIGQEVPEELYPAVAEVLAFVYRLRRKA